MIWNILEWVMMLFALGSGISKVIGIPVERQGAEDLGVDYTYIMGMGVLQLVSIPLIYAGFYWGGVLFLGLPYLYIAYLGIVHKQHMLGSLSLVIVGITILRYMADRW
mgnify:CR=1 FL=1